MYEPALDAGVDPIRFWDYSPGELLDLIDSHERTRIQAMKESVSMAFIHAQVVKRYLFPPEGSNEPPHPWEYYPQLFEREKQDYEARAEAADLDNLKNSRKAYYAEHNRRMKEPDPEQMESDDGE